MARKTRTVAEQRNYSVLDVRSTKRVCLVWLERAQLQKVVGFGLPEVDDRYHIWRVPLLNKGNKERIGEVVIDARTSQRIAVPFDMHRLFIEEGYDFLLFPR